MKLADDVRDIVKAPFVGSLDIMHLFLLIGLTLVFIAAWVMILQHVRVAATELIP